MEGDFISLDDFDPRNEWNEPKPSEKHSDDISKLIKECKVPWVDISLSNEDPYADDDYSVSLHNEILAFSQFILPTPDEHQERLDLIAKISSITSELFAHSSLECYGSFATDLYLPTSDLDLVLMTETPIGKTEMTYIGNALVQRGIPSFMEIISKARIPIIKFIDQETGIAVDISFNNSSSFEGIDFIKRKMQRMPMLKPLTLVLKQFLSSRELNETYSGGLGSFVLQLMVIAFLQIYPTMIMHTQAKQYGMSPRDILQRTNLGVLLISFLQMFGVDFDYLRVGIDITGDSTELFLKWEREMFDKSRPGSLCMVSPLTGDDIGGNSYNILRCRAAFEWAYKELSFIDSKTDAPTLLSRIIPKESVRPRRS